MAFPTGIKHFNVQESIGEFYKNSNKAAEAGMDQGNSKFD